EAIALACAAAVYFPSALSETFLQELDRMESSIRPGKTSRVTKEWLTVWRSHELSRELVAAKPAEGLFGWIQHSERWRFAHLSGGKISVFKAQTFSELERR